MRHKDQDKVVLHTKSGLLKGHTSWSDWTDNWQGNHLISPPVRLLGSDEEQTVSLQGVKAAFLVRSFNGNGNEDLRFHDDLLHADNLWVRVVFLDGEIIEGLIRNDSQYILKDYFFLFPTDPEGNNLSILVLTPQLRDFCVLGLRAASEKPHQ